MACVKVTLFHPFVFIIVMEALSTMMNELVKRGSIEGFEVGRNGSNGMCILHLLFAYDTLILCRADENQVRNLKCLLLCFKAVSGFKINLGKFEVIPIGRVNGIQVLANILGYRVLYF